MAYFSALMEAVFSSDIFINVYRTTWRRTMEILFIVTVLWASNITLQEQDRKMK
jgi:hypothetical protein